MASPSTLRELGLTCGGLAQDDPEVGSGWAGEVLSPVAYLLLGPCRPADDGLGLLPHELEDE